MLNDEIPAIVDCYRFFAGAVRSMPGQVAGEYLSGHTSMVRRDPIGIVASIAPWNYPLQMAAWKILPAIAAGNTIVLKPAEITPLTSLMFAQACTDAGIPDGVVNVVTGKGRTVGEYLMAHRDVSMISFTGSTGVGKRVAEVAIQTVKRMHLELGGKAPFVVFDDADLDAAVLIVLHVGATRACCQSCCACAASGTWSMRRTASRRWPAPSTWHPPTITSCWKLNSCG